MEGGGWLLLTEYADLTQRSELLSQWDVERNAALTPREVQSGSDRKVWWCCDKGHRWWARVSSRTLDGRGCPYCAGVKVLPGETDLQTTHPELAKEWHPDWNGLLKPSQVSAGSDRKVWWCCEQGHQWSSTVSSRALLGRGCPYCSGQRVLSGENDLAARYPEVARFWHPTANGGLTPERVMPGTHRKFHWHCEKGHSWQAAPSVLIAGCGCPYCSGRQAIPGETDLCSTHPDLAAQWHTDKNGNLTPQDVTPGSEKRVWWQCERGHDYAAQVFSRVQGTGCPYCAGRKAWPGFNDLESQFPGLMREWHPTLNQGIEPQKLTKGSHRAVWWQCGEGHVWKTVVYSRTRENGTGCPVCAGNTKRAKAQYIK